MNDSATDPVERTAYITCVLCEASCGLEVKLRDEQIESIRGHEGDPLSRGHICPKAIALQDIHADPDRLRKPVRRAGDDWVEMEWDEAISLVATRLAQVSAARDARKALERRRTASEDWKNIFLLSVTYESRFNSCFS